MSAQRTSPPDSQPDAEDLVIDPALQKLLKTLRLVFTPASVGFGLWWAVLFSDGINGPSWLPLLQDNPGLAQCARIIVYGLMVALFTLALIFRKHLAPLGKRKGLLTASSLLCSISLTFMGVAGLGDTSATLLWASAAAFGVSVTAPILGFYEFLDLLGAKRACISVCGSFIVGAALYFGIALTGSHAPNLAIAAEAMCPLLALPLLLKAWKILPLRADHLAIEHGLLKMPPALLAAMFVYGAAFGLVLSIGTPAETTNLSTLVTNAVYIAVLALVVLALVFKTHRFNIGRVYRPILPLLAVGFILFPVLGQGWMTVTVGIVLAGYACSRIFAATIYADITCRVPAPAMGTAALGGLADAAGIAIGSLVAQGLLAVSGTHAQLVYDVSLVIVGLLIFVTVFLLNESGTSTLWGLLSPAADTPISEATAKARSADVAQAAGLTPREKEVLAYLVRGKPAAEIASELVLSEATVRTHTKRIYTKLGVHSRAELLGAVYFADSPSDHTMA